MPADFTGQLFTADDLRAEVGDPSRSPNAINYMSDAHFQSIVDRNTAIAQGRVDEAVNTRSFEQLLKYQSQAVRISVSLSASSFSTDLAVGTFDSDTYFPYPMKAVSGQVEYVVDEQIETTSNLAAVVEVNRIKIAGNEVYVAPASTTTIHIWVVPKSVISKDLVPAVALETNDLMLRDALNALRNRMAASTQFKEENKAEAP